MASHREGCRPRSSLSFRYAGHGERGERHIVSRGLNGEESEKQRGVDRLGGSLA